METKTWRLGLDLGTNSIGWAALETVEGVPVKLMDMGVRIFSDGRDPQSKESLNVQRRMARQMRRQRYRRKRRIQAVKRVLEKAGYLPTDTPKDEKAVFSLVQTMTRRFNDILSDKYNTTPSFHVSLRSGRTAPETLKILNPYYLRFEALNRKLEPFELGRLMMFFASRRGFKNIRTLNDSDSQKSEKKQSNKNDQSELKEKQSNKNDQSVLKEKMEKLSQELHEKNLRTLGEYLFLERFIPNLFTDLVKNRRARSPFQPNRKLNLRFRGEDQIFPTRAHYDQEFQAIRSAQERYHRSFPWDAVHRIIFFQRPLKPQERGRCLFTGEFRAWKFIPSLQSFRIYQEVNHLKYLDEDNKWKKLPLEKRQELAEILDGERPLPTRRGKGKGLKGKDHKRYLDWGAIKTVLGLKDSVLFNLERDPKREENGLLINYVAEILQDPKYLGAHWKSLSLEERDCLVEILATTADYEELEEKLRRQFPDLPLQNLKNLLELSFKPPQTASVSAKFARTLLPLLKEGYTYAEAVEKAGYKGASPFWNGSRDRLPYYGEVIWDVVVRRKSRTGTTQEEKPDESDPAYMAKAIEYYGRIGNPSVHIALNQLRLLVNRLIERFGKPSEIVLELGRELKSTAERRKEIQIQQKRNQEENARVYNEIQTIFREHGITRAVSKQDILKYRLWEELAADGVGHVCIYTGRPIPLEKLFSEEIQIEHIVPFSKCHLNSRSNLIVAYADANRVKGDQTPWEAFHHNPPGYNWEEIYARAKRAFGGKKKGGKKKGGKKKEEDFYFRAKLSRFAPNALELVRSGEDGQASGFAESQLTDNHYIARAARRYLTAILPQEKIWHSVGALTAMYRRAHGLDTLLIKSTYLRDPVERERVLKNRNDHRHHALDAFVIAHVDRSILKKVNDLSGQGRLQLWEEKNILRQHLPLTEAWKDLQERLKHVIPSLRPKHKVTGNLFYDTALGTIKQRIAIPTLSLKQNQIAHLVDQSIKALLEEKAAGKKSFQMALEELSKTKPTLFVYREVLVKRKSAQAIKPTEFKRVYDPNVQELLNIASQNSEDSERTARNLFDKKGIRRIRIENDKQEAFPIESAPYKSYQFADFLCALVWYVPGGILGRRNYQPIFLSRYEVAKCHGKLDIEKYRPRGPDGRPIPTAKFLGSFYKNDTLELKNKETGLVQYFYLKSFNTADNRFDIFPVFASSEDLAEWARRVPLPSVPEAYHEKISEWKENTSIEYYYKAVNELFSTYRVRRINMGVDGIPRYRK